MVLGWVGLGVRGEGLKACAESFECRVAFFSDRHSAVYASEKDMVPTNVCRVGFCFAGQAIGTDDC